MSDEEIKNKIISFLAENLEDIQKTIYRSPHIPSFLHYDHVTQEIEKNTGLNYIDIMTFLDEPTFNKLFMLEDTNEN